MRLYLCNLLVALDQLGNAICAGNPDATISARCGYFQQAIDRHPYWETMAGVINFTFLPIDGPDHCRQAYQNDPDEKHRDGSDLAKVLLGIVIIVFCVHIGFVLWIMFGWKLYDR